MLPDEPPEPKRLTRQGAISAKCKDCIYDPCEPGNWVQQVTACTSPDCPLFPYRPISKSKKGSHDDSSAALESPEG